MAKIIKTLSMESTVLNMHYVIHIIRLHVTLLRPDWQGQPWPSTSAGNIYCWRSCDVALPFFLSGSKGKLGLRRAICISIATTPTDQQDSLTVHDLTLLLDCGNTVPKFILPKGTILSTLYLSIYCHGDLSSK